MLLPKRASAFWEGHKKSSMVFQKICWEEPEKQKTRSCRAQELSRSCAQWRGQEWREWTEQNHIGERGNWSHKRGSDLDSVRGDRPVSKRPRAGQPFVIASSGDGSEDGRF